MRAAVLPLDRLAEASPWPRTAEDGVHFGCGFRARAGLRAAAGV